MVEYGENREKNYSSVRSVCQEGAGTEEMGEKPKSPYNLFYNEPHRVDTLKIKIPRILGRKKNILLTVDTHVPAY